MPRKLVNPPELFNSLPFGFSQGTVSGAGRTIHVAGQTAWDRDGNIVGPGDLQAQIDQTLKNIGIVLAAEGATPADIVQIRVYVVNHTPDKLDVICGTLAKFFGDAGPAANTLIGVQALAVPDFLIEIDATAVVDA